MSNFDFANVYFQVPPIVSLNVSQDRTIQLHLDLSDIEKAAQFFSAVKRVENDFYYHLRRQNERE